MARGGTQHRHDTGRRRRGRGGRPLRWVAPAVLGTLLGTVVAVVGQAAPVVLGTHGHVAAAAEGGSGGHVAGPVTAGHAASGRPQRTAPSTAAVQAAPSGDPATPSGPSGAPEPSEPPTTSAPARGLADVPDLQSRCPDPATGVVTHARTAPGRTVALTFDDGPDAATPAVLDALAAADVHATFFVVGARAEQHPALLRRIADEGHLLGDHTWDHAYPRDVDGGWSAPYLADQLGRTARVVGAATGRPLCWFRPPGGFLPPTVADAAARMRMTVALWSVDTLDWQVQGVDHRHAAARPDALEKQVDTIVARAIATGGARHPVVLLHDGGGPRTASALAVPRIVEWYRAHGYTFVRLDGRA